MRGVSLAGEERAVQRVEVEILMSPSCPSAGAVADAVRRVAVEAGVLAQLSERVLATVEEAEAARMPGSPTVRIGGRDVEPDAEALQDFGLG
jgi:hypothetical protein